MVRPMTSNIMLIDTDLDLHIACTALLTGSGLPVLRRCDEIRSKWTVGQIALGSGGSIIGGPYILTQVSTPI